MTKKKYPGLDSEFNFETISVKKMEEIFNTIKSNAKGSDDINLKMLSLVMPYLNEHLTFIINKCLSTGTFPSTWKEAYVIPVPKNSNPLSTSDFRPISILPTVSKILEKIVHEQLAAYLEHNNILPVTQSGFRTGHSTTTALLHVSDELYRTVDNQQNSCLLLLDYSKAFDTLDHSALCSKLRYFGVSNVAVQFFSDYLDNRRQRVVTDGVLSDIINIKKGVPQGSVLGPLLFSIYTADFSKFLKYCDSHQYADDLQISFNFSLNDVVIAVNKINMDLATICRISKAHGLILNEAKTQLLVIGRHRDKILNNPSFNIKLNGVVLTPSNHCKNLGVFFDYNLRFQNHVSHLIQKSYSKLKVLYIHKDKLTTDVKLKLCDSLILSYLAYCDVLYWPALLRKDKVRLQRLQNSCVRFSYNLRKYDHISGRFSDSKWLNLDERFRFHMACLVYKIDMFKTPRYLYDKLTKVSAIHNRPTRNNSLYAAPRHSTSLFERSFSHNAVKIFNQLPPTLKSLTSLNSFRKQVKASILDTRDN